MVSHNSTDLQVAEMHHDAQQYASKGSEEEIAG